MARQQERFYTTNSSGQALLVCGFTAVLGSSLHEASTLLGHLLSCLAGELLQAALWVFITICRALAAHVLDSERIVVSYQCLAAMGPLVHCLLWGK